MQESQPQIMLLNFWIYVDEFNASDSTIDGRLVVVERTDLTIKDNHQYLEYSRNIMKKVSTHKSEGRTSKAYRNKNPFHAYLSQMTFW